jgi:hypothetical protein
MPQCACMLFLRRMILRGHYAEKEVAAKIADELNVTVDYLLGSSNKMVLDKKLMKRMEDIEALPAEEKDKVYYFIDMALSHHKAKKAFANK